MGSRYLLACIYASNGEDLQRFFQMSQKMMKRNSKAKLETEVNQQRSKVEKRHNDRPETS
jgi:hypothetical protein